MDLSQYLKKIRTKAGLTQKDLSSILNYSSPQFVSNWERGISAPPTKVLPLIADACGVGGEELSRTFCEFKMEQVRRKYGKV